MYQRGHGVVTVTMTVATLVASVACVAFLVAWWRSDRAQGPSARDLAGNVATFDAPDPAAARVEELGETFEVPGLALSVPLLRASVVDGVIDPPTLTDAYLYREYGDPARPRTGTAVVAVHSVRGGLAPGNALVAQPAAGASGAAGVRISPGEEIVVAGVAYRVVDTVLLTKTESAADRTLWDGRHGLVVVTCFPDPGVPLAEQRNLVVLAERLAGGVARTGGGPRSSVEQFSL